MLFDMELLRLFVAVQCACKDALACCRPVKHILAKGTAQQSAHTCKAFAMLSPVPLVSRSFSVNRGIVGRALLFALVPVSRLFHTFALILSQSRRDANAPILPRRLLR